MNTFVSLEKIIIYLLSIQYGDSLQKHIRITCSMFCNQMGRFICPSVDMISPLETPYLWYIDGTSSSRLQRNKFTHNKTKLNTNEIEHFDVALKGKLLFSENIFRFGRRITQCIRFEQLCNEKSYFGASCLAVVISRSRKRFYSLFILRKIVDKRKVLF